MADTAESSGPAACCPPDSIGRAAPPADQELRGEEVQLCEGALTLYVSKPAGGRTSGSAVLVLHDVFGHDSGRTKLICDALASEGHTVVMPYLFQHGVLDEKHDSLNSGRKPSLLSQLGSLVHMIRWLQQYKWTSVGPLLTEHVLPYMTAELGAERVGMACFCWGMYPMVHLLSQQRPEIKCGVGFHPSLQVFTAVQPFTSKGALLGLAEAPIMLLAAGGDAGDVKAGGLVDKQFRDKPFHDKCVFKEFKDMKHGWVNRGDLTDAATKRDYEEAMSMATSFFAEHLADASSN